MATLPIGAIIIWPSDDAVPDGWQLCDGTSGTPDLSARLVPGAGHDYAVGAQGGSGELKVPSHQHGLGDTTLAGGSEAAHAHGWDLELGVASSSAPATTGLIPVEPTAGHDHLLLHDNPSLVETGGEHEHALSGIYDSGSVDTLLKLPSTIAFHFIQRLS